MKKANCPDCDAEIEVPDDVMKGEILSCPSCGLELEVTENKGDSVELKELGIEGEDWGEYIFPFIISLMFTYETEKRQTEKHLWIIKRLKQG